MMKQKLPHLLKHLQILIIYLFFSFSNSQIICQLNPNCFQGCSDSVCIYDPSTNPFYNSSISNTSTAYNGPYCCSGCNSGYFLWMDLKTCSQSCNLMSGIPTFGNPLTRTCDFVCPNPYLGDISTTKCVMKCANDYWVSFSLNQCVFVCPSNFKFHYTINKTCLSGCPQGNFTYVEANFRAICSPTCPNPLFGYLGTKSCINRCPDQLFGYLVSGLCVDNCPDPTYKHPTSKKCESLCFGNYRYGDSLLNSCVNTCSQDLTQKKQTYGENITSTCVYYCPSNSYAHPTVKICVSICFGNFSKANNQTNQCQQEITVQQSNSNKLTLTIIISLLISLVVIIIGSFLFYKYYLKKRLIRKPWKYNNVNDINFSL